MPKKELMTVELLGDGYARITMLVWAPASLTNYRVRGSEAIKRIMKFALMFAAGVVMEEHQPVGNFLMEYVRAMAPDDPSAEEH